MKKKAPRMPQGRMGLMDQNFKYTPAASTDVTQTWRKFGWLPAAERQGEKK